MAECFWFLTKGPGFTSVVYLTPAKRREEVVNTLGKLHKGGEILMLTWSQLRDVIGCDIPNNAKHGGFARGNIVIPRKHKVTVVIWPVP